MEPPDSAGIGPGDCPPFDGMHEASATIAGGSIDAVDRILRGESRSHAFNPGGGLHHAMAGRASGFCIYNDVALGVARARDAGHRVLYVDLDVHHGDGTQALFWDDPQVLTFSIHETGLSALPGHRLRRRARRPRRAGQLAQCPAPAVQRRRFLDRRGQKVVPALADAFGPTFLVTQNGCDTHAYDPLAHLRLTTNAYRAATLLLDKIAHEYCEGRWLATGGGGYDAYRVVPRSWSLVWLAQAHRDVPAQIADEWRAAWRDEAERFDQAPLPESYLDPHGPGRAGVEGPGRAQRQDGG